MVYTPTPTISSKGSFAPSHTPDLSIPPSLAWRRAVDRYIQDGNLTQEEQKALKLSNPSDFMTDLQSVELSHLQKSRIKKYLDKLQPLFDSLGRFEKALDVISSSDPYGVLSLVWGSVRMCLVVIKDYSELYDMLIEFFKEIEDDVGRLTVYEALFAESKRFNLALCAVFENLLDFCAWFRMKTRSKSKLTAKMVFFASLKKEAALKISRFHALCIKTESEAQLAGAESEVKFQKSATQFFKEARSAHQMQAAGLQNELLKSLHDKLAPVPVAEHFETLQRKRFEGTCNWVMSSKHFGHLLSQHHTDIQPRITWLTGVPGCGKTYLSAYLIGRLQSIRPVAYFFCDTKDVSKKSPANILRTWAWQLCQLASGVAGEVLRHLGPMSEITTNALKSLFAVILKHNSAFLLLDGLDELDPEDRVEILNVIGDLARSAYVIIVSRKERDIDMKLRELEEDRNVPISRLQISSTDTAEDIKRYLIIEVQKCEIKDPVLVTKIVQEVGSRARGMFLYVRLMLNELNQSDTDEERHEVLQQLPEGIEQVYSRSMDKIKALKGTRKARIIRLLQCVIYATRPMTLSELEIALAVVPGESQFRPGNVPNVSKLFLEFCTSLLELDEESETLGCIHTTAKEYLRFASKEDQLIDPITAHANLASLCITYLTYEDRGFVDRSEVDCTAIPFAEPWPWFEYLHFPFHLHVEEHRFIQYSTANWALHFSQLAEVDDVNNSVQQCLAAVNDLLSSEEKLLRWLEMFHFLNSEGIDNARQSSDLIDAWILQYEDGKVGPELAAHFAEQNAFAKFAFSFNGFPLIDTKEADELRKATTIYPSRTLIKQLEPAWSFALDHLGFSEHHGIYRWRRFTKIEPITRKPVHMGAFFDMTDFVIQQLDSGVDVNDRCATDRSIINKAAFGEATQTCKILIDRKADIDQCPDFTFFDGNRPIGHAMFDDQFVPLRPRDYGTARFLLRKGAKVQSNENPLHPLHTIFDFWAETAAQMDTLKELLDGAEDVISLLETPSPYNGMTPLQIVSRNNLEKTVGAILARHPDPQKYASMTWGVDGKTALHEVCFTKQSRCGPPLLDTGMDVNILTVISKSTPLHIAAVSRSDMLPRLLENSADASIPDGAGRLPLHLAAVQDWIEGIAALLPYTPDINAQDARGHTALAVASLQGSKNAVTALLQAGAAPMTNGNANSNHLHRPKSASNVFEVYFLLSCAFNFRAPNELLIQIIDDAEYWVRSSLHVAQPLPIQQADAGRPYILSKPLSMPGAAIRKLRISMTCEATEGEYTALFPERKSWTWFNLTRKEGSTGELLAGPRLVENDIEIEGKQTHECIVYTSDRSSDLANWLSRLKKGDAIGVVPMARWPQRVNTVFEASVEIYSSMMKGIEDVVIEGGERRVIVGWADML